MNDFYFLVICMLLAYVGDKLRHIHFTLKQIKEGAK